jgi:hypothetical protein
MDEGTDTYDTVAGARKAATVGHEMRAAGHDLLAVRLDSGDLVHLSRRVREILDAAGISYSALGKDETCCGYISFWWERKNSERPRRKI